MRHKRTVAILGDSLFTTAIGRGLGARQDVEVLYIRQALFNPFEWNVDLIVFDCGNIPSRAFLAASLPAWMGIPKPVLMLVEPCVNRCAVLMDNATPLPADIWDLIFAICGDAMTCELRTVGPPIFSMS